MVNLGIALKLTTQYDFLSETANQLLSKNEFLSFFIMKLNEKFEKDIALLYKYYIDLLLLIL